MIPTILALYSAVIALSFYSFAAPVDNPSGIALEVLWLPKNATSTTSITMSASLATSTVTEIVTITSIFQLATSTPTAWAQPERIPNLNTFNIASFAGGQHNLEIVNGIPLSASAVLSLASFKVEATSVPIPALPPFIPPPSSPRWDNSTSVIQIFYPAGSTDPKSQPRGGAEFYATPLNISDAVNVTLEYSVFFPAGFDWVRGGKLPGLYGGHTGCSGGNDALQCFSTRLMWRSQGAGELYLYAPKAKQTEALCSAPQSVCDMAYGLSVGRGSFYFTAGGWTHVRQTVTLNTPGQQDGCFTLDVDGKRVINRTDIFYRDVSSPLIPSSSAVSTGDDNDNTGESLSQGIDPYTTLNASQLPNNPYTPSTHPPGAIGGLFDPLLGASGLVRRHVDVNTRHGHLANIQVYMLSDTDAMMLLQEDSGVRVVEGGVGPMWGDREPAETISEASTSKSTTRHPTLSTATTVTTGELPAGVAQVPSGGLVSFTGIFFSTFFGGHEEQFATPEDQFTYFKDFAMARNG